MKIERNGIFDIDITDTQVQLIRTDGNSPVTVFTEV